MGTTAVNLIERFFKRRDEQEDEVFSVATAVAFLNEAQQELIGLKLLVKEAVLSFAIGDPEIDLPDDFSALATDRAYMNGLAYLWQDYDGPTSAGLFILPGRKSIRLYPAPTATTEIRFKYFYIPPEIADDPDDDVEVMDGLVAPALDKFLIHRMLEMASFIDEEAQVAESYSVRAEKAKSEIVLWKQNTYNTEQAAWVEDPWIEESDAYVDNY
jgi:hypothetical protein